MALSNPNTSPSKVRTPLLIVDGVVKGDVIKLYSDSGCSAQLATGITSGASISFNIATPLNDGVYKFYANATDPTGNRSSCSSSYASYTVDNTPPSRPSSLSLSAPVSSPSNDTTPTIRINGVSSTDTITLYSNATCSAQVATGQADGNIIYLTTSILSEANHRFYARAQDIAGNISPCSSSSVVYALDITPPNMPSAIYRYSPTASIGDDTTPTLQVRGTVNGDIVKVFTNSSCSTEVASSRASSSYLNISTRALAKGQYRFYTKSYDTAGNSSRCSSSSISYQVGFPAPPADGKVQNSSGTWLNLRYIKCGNGAKNNCNEANAKRACLSVGGKLAAQAANNGLRDVYNLGSSNSCSWQLYSFKTTNPAFNSGSKCLIAPSNSDWSSCCGTSGWHGRTMRIGSTSTSSFGPGQGEYWGCNNEGTTPTSKRGGSVSCSYYEHYVPCVVEGGGSSSGGSQGVAVFKSSYNGAQVEAIRYNG